MSNEITRYFELLEQLVADEHQRQEEADQRFLNKRTWFRCLQAICLTFWGFGILLWLFSFSTTPWVKGVAALSLSLAFLAFILTLISVYYSKGSALTTARCNGEVDFKYLSMLTGFSTQTLELGCLELEHGRNWFSKGMASFVGVIDKIGLIPSVLSLAALYALPDKLPEWAMPLVFVCGLLYFMSFILQQRINRFDRMIDLTKLALKQKEVNKNLPK